MSLKIITSKDIKYILSGKKIKKKKAPKTIYVARFKYENNTVKFGNAMPCLLCYRIMEGIGVKKVIFTTETDKGYDVKYIHQINNICKPSKNQINIYAGDKSDFYKKNILHLLK